MPLAPHSTTDTAADPAALPQGVTAARVRTRVAVEAATLAAATAVDAVLQGAGSLWVCSTVLLAVLQVPRVLSQELRRLLPLEDEGQH